MSFHPDRPGRGLPAGRHCTGMNAWIPPGALCGGLGGKTGPFRVSTLTLAGQSFTSIPARDSAQHLTRGIANNKKEPAIQVGCRIVWAVRKFAPISSCTVRYRTGTSRRSKCSGKQKPRGELGLSETAGRSLLPAWVSVSDEIIPQENHLTAIATAKARLQMLQVERGITWIL